MLRRGVRGGIVAAVLVLAQLSAGLGASGATPREVCAAPERLFAVHGDTGHLVELEWCANLKSITEVGAVDGSDWRTATRLFAAGDGAVTVVYALTADGRLEARRQDSPGAPLGAPVEVGAGIDWSRFRTVLVPRRGFLWADDGGVRQFRHVGWDTGGATLVEGPAVFTRPSEWPATGDLELTGLNWNGRAEARFAGTHWRVWRGEDGRPVAYPSGRRPYRVSGTEADPYTVHDGAVHRLVQPLYPKDWPVNYSNCLVNTMTWQLGAGLPGGWSEVVVPQLVSLADGWPVVTDEWPEVSPPPSGSGPGTGPCPQGVEPYEWQ